MKLYAETLEECKVGDRVIVATQDGKLVASKKLTKGNPGIIEQLRGKVAFVSIQKEATPALGVNTGNALGVTLEVPVKGTTSLKITYDP